MVVFIIYSIIFRYIFRFVVLSDKIFYISMDFFKRCCFCFSNTSDVRCIADSNKENGRVDVKDDEEESVEDGKTPTFAVLLHGSLKVENMVAVVKVGYVFYF